MGLIREEFGVITIEQRRESFIVYDDSSESMEFSNGDLDNLIAALTDLRVALHSDGRADG